MDYISMSKQQFIDTLKEAYGIDADDDYDMERGCYVNGRWLSLEAVVNVIFNP